MIIVDHVVHVVIREHVVPRGSASVTSIMEYEQSIWLVFPKDISHLGIIIFEHVEACVRVRLVYWLKGIKSWEVFEVVDDLLDTVDGLLKLGIIVSRVRL